MNDHEAWLRSLPSLAHRIVYDRAYGKAFYEGKAKPLCQAAGREAVKRYERRHEAAREK